VAGVAASKLGDFVGEAEVADAAVLRDYGGTKKAALLAAMVFTAQARARDDVAEMFCRRVATLTKRARRELEELREQHRVLTERLVANYRAVLERIDPDGPDGAQHLAALEMARKTVESVGGFAGQYADIDRVSAHHGDKPRAAGGPALPPGPGGDAGHGRGAGAAGHQRRPQRPGSLGLRAGGHGADP
jgi:hypothetical protein